MTRGRGSPFGDVLPFMAGLRARGIKVAIISNCDEQGRGKRSHTQPAQLTSSGNSSATVPRQGIGRPGASTGTSPLASRPLAQRRSDYDPYLRGER